MSSGKSKSKVKPEPKNIIPSVQFNTKLAYYDNSVNMFFVKFDGTTFPLNNLIALVIGFDGKFQSLGMAYNHSVGRLRMELSIMYEIMSDSGFDEALTATIKSAQPTTTVNQPAS